MSRPFDATLKAMLEAAPSDWVALAGYAPAAVDVIDADISTVSGAADKVLRVQGPPDWILHIDFQTGPDATLPCRTHVYNALLEHRHQLLVRSALVLLQPQAALSNLTGVYERNFSGEPAHLTFRYRVLRVWELPVEQLLTGGAGTLPLAPISDVTEAELPGVIGRMQERLRGRPRAEVGKQWTATYVLMGLCYEQALVDRLLEGVVAMEDSVTYQAIIAKGEQRGALREARKTLLMLGREQFGAPTPEVTAAIEAINDLDRLEQLSIRVLHAGSWQELLDLPRRPPRRRKRAPKNKS
jgi:predicted transposase YdaD